mmetsp:Transcript_38733/g.43221  ORF Transcript_38733/g.43221 Transcript_38733/m.43221 type:complete len:96 (-) Transcript_38733:64-351(-)
MCAIGEFQLCLTLISSMTYSIMGWEAIRTSKYHLLHNPSYFVVRVVGRLVKITQNSSNTSRDGNDHNTSSSSRNRNRNSTTHYNTFLDSPTKTLS